MMTKLTFILISLSLFLLIWISNANSITSLTSFQDDDGSIGLEVVFSTTTGSMFQIDLLFPSEFVNGRPRTPNSPNIKRCTMKTSTTPETPFNFQTSPHDVRIPQTGLVDYPSTSAKWARDTIDTFTLRCLLEVPFAYSVNVVLADYQNNGTLGENIIISPFSPSLPHEMIPLTITANRATNQVTLTFDRIYGFVHVKLAKLLGLTVVDAFDVSSGATPITCSAYVLNSNIFTPSPIIVSIDPTTGQMIFPSGLVDRAVSIKCSGPMHASLLTGEDSKSLAYSIQTIPSLFTTQTSKVFVKFIGDNVPGSNIRDSIRLVSVAVDNGNVDGYTSPGADRNVNFKYQYKITLPPTAARTITIRPPPILTNYITLVDPLHDLPLANLVMMSHGEGIIITIAEGDKSATEYTLSFTAVSSFFTAHQVGPFQNPYIYADPMVQMESTGAGEFYTPQPWSIEAIPQIGTSSGQIRPLSDMISTLPVTVFPSQYGQFYDRQWTIRVAGWGSYREKFPVYVIRATDETAPLISSLAPKSITGRYLTDVTSIPTFTTLPPSDPYLKKSGSGYAEFTCDDFSSADVVLFDLNSVYTLTLVSNSVPITGQITVTLKLGDQEVSGVYDLPIPHLPTTTVSSTLQGVNNVKRSPTTLVPITTTLSGVPLLYPTGYGSAMLYPGTTMDFTFRITGGKFLLPASEHSCTSSTLGFLFDSLAVNPTGDEIRCTVDYNESTLTLSGQSILASLAVAGDTALDVTITTYVTITLDNQSVVNLVSPPYPVKFNFADFGSVVITLAHPTTGHISTLSPTAPTTPPSYVLGSTLQVSLTQPANGFTDISVGLYHHDGVNDVLIKDLSKPFATPGTTLFTTQLNLRKIYTNVFIRFRHRYPVTNGVANEDEVKDSILFNLIPACMIEDVDNIGAFIPNCPQANHHCSTTTGHCEEIITDNTTTPTNPLPSTPLPPNAERCPQCDQTNTNTCTAKDEVNNILSTCQCKEGWSGLTCKQTTSCDATKSKCNPKNGYALPLPGSTKCESTCNCYNQWAGLNCQSCQLQCFNDGLRYNDCARCGCQEGYSGSQCQCQSVEANVSISATNEIIIATGGKLLSNSDNTDSLFEIDSKHFTNFIFPGTTKPTQQQIDFLSLIRDVYNGLKTPLTSSSDGQYSMTIHPNDDKTKTQFNFAITFNCQGNNEHITSLEALKQKWNNFVNGFIAQPVIQTYFTFESDVVESEIEPTPPSLPPAGEEYRSGTARVSLFFVFVVVLLMFTAITF